MTLVMALVSTLAISFGNGLDTVFLPISTDEIPIIGPIYGLDVILICISVAYGVFPILYNNLGQLKKYGKDKTKEYLLVKKILSIEIPLVMVLGIFFVAYFSPILKDFYLPEDGLAGLVVNYLFNLVYYVAFAATGGLLWIALDHLDKEFNFHLAKECFENIAWKNDVSKIEYTKNGLEYYNRYLEKALKTSDK